VNIDGKKVIDASYPKTVEGHGRRFGNATADTKNDDDEIWITVGTDAIPLLHETRMIGTQYASIALKNQTNSAVLHTTYQTLKTLDHVLRNRYGLGGFTLHGSEAEARAYSKKVESNCMKTQVALNYTINNPHVAKYLSNRMTKHNLEKTVAELSNWFNRNMMSYHGFNASRWLKEHWEKLSTMRHDINIRFFEHTNRTIKPWLPLVQPSVIATVEGSSSNNEIVILGAHIDTYNVLNWMNDTKLSPGSDDNASGVAILTELLRVIVETGYVPEKAIHIVGYAAEEYGLIGSRGIASHYLDSEKKVIGALNLDMTGYKASQKDIYIITDYTNPSQNEFLVGLIERYLTQLTVGYTECKYSCSDHFSWCAENVPSSFPFESSFLDLDRNRIHSSQDNKVYANHMLKFSKLAAVYVAELAKGRFDLSKRIYDKYNVNYLD